MTCYHPIQAWRKRGAFDPRTGKWPLTFKHQDGVLPVLIPCGHCIGCRLEYSRQWAIRCVHESLMYEHNVFVTLTFDDKHLPPDLSVRDVQLFMKRLRKEKNGSRVRFFAAGEYGEKLGRPHYHIILFNCDFEDKVYYKTVRGNRLYVSPTLDKLWGNGFAVIGDVTFESCAYVARYVTKKINGDKADEHYYLPGTDLIRTPEFATMSRKPGIGRPFLDKYKNDVYGYDRVLIRGHLSKPPTFYDRCLETLDPDEYARTLKKRLKVKRHMLLHRAADNTPERLDVRERCKLNSINFLARKYEQGIDS